MNKRFWYEWFFVVVIFAGILLFHDNYHGTKADGFYAYPPPYYITPTSIPTVQPTPFVYVVEEEVPDRIAVLCDRSDWLCMIYQIYAMLIGDVPLPWE